MESNFQRCILLETGAEETQNRGKCISLKGDAYWRELRTWRMNSNISGGCSGAYVAQCQSSRSLEIVHSYVPYMDILLSTWYMTHHTLHYLLFVYLCSALCLPLYILRLFPRSPPVLVGRASPTYSGRFVSLM